MSMALSSRRRAWRRPSATAPRRTCASWVPQSAARCVQAQGGGGNWGLPKAGVEVRQRKVVEGIGGCQRRACKCIRGCLGRRAVSRGLQAI